MQKGELIKEICLHLLTGDKAASSELLKKKYPFDSVRIDERKFNLTEKINVFLEDGFIDRYSGDKLVFPGILEIVTAKLPNDFPKQSKWKMSETHIAYWELYPTIDHVTPIARGGKDEPSNCVTTSMIRNDAKANWTLAEIGWSMKAKGKLEDWDGLTALFQDLLKKNSELRKNKTIKNWEFALVKALSKK
jgi:hypothetical protein